MIIEVVPTPQELGDIDADTAVVVVDVFRASTTVTTALANGARFILPVIDVEQAMKLAEPYADSELVMGGERDCVRIDGFPLGNSPREYTREAVGGKVIIFTTSNGTRALLAARDAGAVFVGCFLNISRVTAALAGWSRVVVLCAGNNGRVSLEDFACAGSIVDRLVPREQPAAETAKPRKRRLSPALDLGEDGPRLDDGAFAAWATFRQLSRDISRQLLSTGHARRLAGLGFAADLDAALRVDSAPILPVLADGRIEARPD